MSSRNKIKFSKRGMFKITWEEGVKVKYSQVQLFKLDIWSIGYSSQLGMATHNLDKSGIVICHYCTLTVARRNTDPQWWQQQGSEYLPRSQLGVNFMVHLITRFYNIYIQNCKILNFELSENFLLWRVQTNAWSSSMLEHFMSVHCIGALFT